MRMGCALVQMDLGGEQILIPVPRPEPLNRPVEKLPRGILVKASLLETMNPIARTWLSLIFLFVFSSPIRRSMACSSGTGLSSPARQMYPMCRPLWSTSLA